MAFKTNYKMKTIDEKIKKYEAKIAKLKLKKEQQESPEKFAVSFFEQDLICKSDKEKYPNSIFYFNGDNCLLEIEKSGDSLYAWVNYHEIWNPTSEKFSLNYTQMKSLLKMTIEQHFKLRDVVTTWTDMMKEWMIEQHFKFKDVATSSITNK